MFRPTVLLTAAVSVFATLGSAPARAAGIPAAIAAAVANPARPEADTKRDAVRLPAETLAFAGIKPGEKIGELLPGGGYFTRLFSLSVGPKGRIYAVAPERPANAPADMPDRAAAVRAIAADPAFPNVTVLVEPLASISFPVPLDLIWTSQNYHDLHNVPGLDVAALNRRIFEALKRGGIYLVLDHAAAAGSGTRDTATLHRIDPETVKTEVLAAGFVLASSSDALHRPADTHEMKVQDPSIRGNTDQFILKFRKP